MQKIDKFTHAAKVVALCLPPVVMSLIGLAALSRKKDAAAVVDGKEPGADPGHCTAQRHVITRSPRGASTAGVYPRAIRRVAHFAFGIARRQRAEPSGYFDL